MLKSIRRRLSLMMLASVALVWGGALASSYWHALHEVQTWEDARLVEFARLIAPLDAQYLARLAQSPFDVRIELPGLEERSDPATDSDRLPRGILIEVRDASGKTIAASPQLTSFGTVPHRPSGAQGPWSATFGNTVWRIYTLRDAGSGRTVRVMETSNTRSDLASAAARNVTKPLLLALPLLALLVWFAIGHSLAPLKTLSVAIGTRDAQTLDPVGIDRVPAEVQPLVNALNQLLSRLRHSFARERAFTSDAAHELKTPLAAIKVHAQVALGTTDAELQRLAMQRVVQGVDRSARLAEQLLLLARLDEHERIPASPVAVDALAYEAIERHAEHASKKQIAIEMNSVHRVPLVHAEPVLIGILLDNLLDNAIKYGISGGRIQVSIRPDTDTLKLAVLDDGPGVSEVQRERLTARFYRAGAGASAAGSGLGLSIVERVARYFGARLSFGRGLDGRGLIVEIAFRYADAKSAPLIAPIPPV